MAKNYRPIPIPDGVQLTVKPGQLDVKGKLGALSVSVIPRLEVKSDNKEVSVVAGAGVPRAQVGTLRALLRNAFVGVSRGFEKAVQVRGMGYRVQETNAGVQIQCGYSHTVDLAIPKGLTCEIKQLPNPDDTKQQMFEIVLRGIDRQLVGQVAAEIRAIKPPDPYKGKGIRYRGEMVRRKAGKRAVGTQA